MVNTETPTRPVTEVTAAAPSSGWRRHEWLIPAACCLILLAQLLLGVNHLSMTCDEPTHLYAGYRYWKCGDFGFGPEHPPLAKLVAAAPLLARHMDMDCRIPERDEAWAALEWIYSHNVERTLAISRATICVFALGLCLLVWIAARRMFGLTTALVAVLLYIFDPNILAIAPLVSTDMVLTFTMPLAAYAFYLWTQKRSALTLLGAGVATGLALVAKMSSMTIVPTLLLLALMDVLLQTRDWRLRRRLLLRNLLVMVMIGLIAAGVIWGVYGLRFDARPHGGHLIPADTGASLLGKVLSGVIAHHLLPEAYAEGVRRVGVMSGHPYMMFLWGRLYIRGAWYFFPANMLVKYTVALLALLLIAGFGAKYLYRQQRREFWFMTIPGLVFLLTTITMNRMPSNIRHVLPLTWTAVIFAAAGSVALVRRRPWIKYLIVAALVLHVASSLHAFPYYMSYANELWGGPANAYKRVPNNDMGEAFKAAKDYMAQRPGEDCWIAHIYLIDAAPYGVPCHQFWGGNTEAIPPHVHGIIILDSLYVENAQESWIAPVTRLHEPVARLAGSAMLVYEGDFDTRAASGASHALIAARAMGKAQFDVALREAKAGVEVAPEQSWPRWEYCEALVATNAIAEARTQCLVARALPHEGKAIVHQDGVHQFEITDPRSGMGIEEAIRAQQFNARRDFDAALPHARNAVALADRSGLAHQAYCQTLLGRHDFQTADGECRTARMLQLNDPMIRGYMGGNGPNAPIKLDMSILMLHAIDGELR